MALEMVAGRLVTRHLGSSIYGWSSVIAVLLAGLSLGNLLGGKVADFIRNEQQASWLFLLASILTLSVIVMETPPYRFLVKYLPTKVAAWIPEHSVLMNAPSMTSLSLPGGYQVPLTWPYRILIVVTLVFFLPALSLGTVSPVVAKLAVDRRRRLGSAGTAIGQVYAWGMVGSILGTFLTGFFLIDVLGTKGVILILGTILALSATFLGDLVHAIWAGIPLGLCVIAFTPPAWAGTSPISSGSSPRGSTSNRSGRWARTWGIREPVGDPTTKLEEIAWIDESDYYYIKIENEPEDGGELQRRTLVLDNLIHGYFLLDHPERLDYDYEHIYALVAYRAAKASGKVKFKPAPEGQPAGATPPGSPSSVPPPGESGAGEAGRARSLGEVRRARSEAGRADGEARMPRQRRSPIPPPRAEPDCGASRWPPRTARRRHRPRRPRRPIRTRRRRPLPTPRPPRIPARPTAARPPPPKRRSPSLRRSPARRMRRRSWRARCRP